MVPLLGTTTEVRIRKDVVVGEEREGGGNRRMVSSLGNEGRGRKGRQERNNR